MSPLTAVSACPESLVVFNCSISGTFLSWTVDVPDNTAQMVSLTSRQVVAVQTLLVASELFLIERVSSDPFEVHLSVNASSALNGTLISCSDGEDTETVTLSITGMQLAF